jgi:hypothetical protein
MYSLRAHCLFNTQKSDSSMLQGRWRGQEIRGKVPGPCYVVVRGNSAEFRGADTNEWYKVTFVLKGDSGPK